MKKKENINFIAGFADWLILYNSGERQPIWRDSIRSEIGLLYWQTHMNQN